MMQMASGIVFPSNVKVKTITIDTLPPNGTDIEVDNPFGRADMDNLLGVTFQKTESGYSKCVAFFANPTKGLPDDNYNRKVVSVNGYLMQSSYYAVASVTAEKIKLRNTGTYNLMTGTWYLFAW